MIRKKICICGNDSYEEIIDFDSRQPLWKCVNCGKKTHRQIRSHTKEYFIKQEMKKYGI